MTMSSKLLLKNSLTQDKEMMLIKRLFSTSHLQRLYKKTKSGINIKTFLQSKPNIHTSGLVLDKLTDSTGYLFLENDTSKCPNTP